MVGLLLNEPKFLACFCNCTGWFVSDLVVTINCWFSHAMAKMLGNLTIFIQLPPFLQDRINF